MSTETSHYRTIVLGATFAGLGAALEDIDGTLVIERTAQVGHEFINSFNPGRNWNGTALSPSGASLKEELRERGILSDDGLVHLPALAPVLYNRIHDSVLRILLLTEVLHVENRGDRVVVTIHHASGRRVVSADKLIDTRTEAVMPGEIAAKRMNAMLLYGGEEELRDVELPSPSTARTIGAGAEIVRCKLRGEWILKLPIDKDDDWVQAREKLNRFWTERTPEWADWTICAVATSFEVEAVPGGGAEDGRIRRLISAAYSNPLEAYEAGIAASGRSVGGLC